MQNASGSFIVEIDSESLESAAKMFIYLNTCSSYITDWADFYIELLQNTEMSKIILTINRLIHTTKRQPQLQKIAIFILGKDSLIKKVIL